MVATTCQDLIDRAMRAMGVIAGHQTTEGADAETGLRALQDIINSQAGLMDGLWTDVFLSDASDYEASDGERIFTNGYAAAITLPTTYVNDCSETVAMDDCARVQILGADHDQAGVWLYIASKGEWVQVDDLAITDDSPFGKEDDAGFAALIAVGLVTEYGSEVAEITINRASKFQRSLRARLYRSGDTREEAKRERWY